MSSSSTLQSPDGRPVLVCRVRDRLCAIPVDEIEETMRPLPIAPVPHAHRFVTGVARIRGAPVPVVDACVLLGTDGLPARARLVLLRVGEHRVALAVEEVVGLRWMEPARLHRLPPLLSEASREAVAAIAALDGELMVVLDAVGLLGADGAEIEARP